MLSLAAVGEVLMAPSQSTAVCCLAYYAYFLLARTLLRRLFPTTLLVADKHCVVTGGSEGLGLAIATRYAEAGAKVTLVSRSSVKLEAAKATLLGVVPAARVAVVPCDVTEDEAVRAMVDTAERAHGPIDHLVCSAGGACTGYFEQTGRGSRGGRQSARCGPSWRCCRA